MATSKDHVRELYDLKRSMLPENARAEMDQKICALFLDAFAFEDINVIHTYLPIQKRIEVDTYPIINALKENHPSIRIVVPVTIMTDRLLKHFYWKPGDPLVENKWNIPEPDPDQSMPAEIQDFDLVVIPLMAFDLKGNRIGYGAGFYDRFLADCKDETMMVGLSHFPHEDQWITSEQYDIDLDYCITPERVYKF